MHVRNPIALAFTFAALACGGHPTAPLVSDGHLCELDTHCPAGSHCVAGVCDQGCRADTDCPLGQSCDPRGRCLLPGAKPPAPRLYGHLVAPPAMLSLSPGAPEGGFSIGNDGTEPLTFHVLPDDPALTATPSSGSVSPGGATPVKVRIAPTFAGRSATVHVLTTGGGSDLDIEYDSPLAGRLEGTVTVSGPYPLGDAPFAVELAGPPSAMAGALDGAASLLWPVNAASQASDDGVQFQVGFTFVAQPGQPGNPLLDVPVERSVTLSGKHQGGSVVSGSYTETIAGLPGAPLTATGSFTLRRVGPMSTPGLTPVSPPAFSPAAPSRLPACDGSCGDAASCFSEAFPFEQWGAGWSYSPDGNCMNGAALVACVNPGAIGCALADSQGSALLDVLRAEASDGLLAGKDAIAQLVQPAGGIGSASLEAEIQGLEGGAAILAGALHGSGGLFASGSYQLARALPASAFIPAASQDCLGGDDLAGFGGAIAARLFGLAQALDRIERGGDSAQVGESLAQGAASGVLLDLAALGGLNLLAPPSGPPTIEGLSEAMRMVDGTFSRLLAGLNPAGFAADYVPFVYDPTHPEQDLYEQTAALAAPFLSQAQGDEAALKSDSRAFDQSSSALASAAQGVAGALGQSVASLCGSVQDPTNPGPDCGKRSGSIKTATDQLTAAKISLMEARDRLSSAEQKLELLQQQAKAQQKDEEATLEAVEQDGKTLELMAVRKAEERLANEAMQCANSVVGALQSGIAAVAGIAVGGVGIPASGCFPLVNSVAFKDVGDAEAAAQAQADIQERFLIGQQEIADAQLKQALQAASADARTAKFEVQEKAQLFDVAKDQLRSLLAELAQALSEARQATAIVAHDGRAVPTDRLYRDADGLAWAGDLTLLRKWAFLTVRALEYVLDASVPEEGQVFSAESAEQLAGLLSSLRDEHDSAQLSAGWDQDREDVVSLAEDVLGITGPVVDPVTGQTLAPGEQLQQLLALPKSRDAAGNLRLRFATSVDQGGLFSEDVAVDTIVGVKMSMVGSLAGRTAYFTLTQAGETRLRDFGGSLVPYELEPKTALVPAGVNLASPGDPSVPESTDLFERPVDCAAWTLSLDQQGDPRNAAVDLSQLTDLQLFVHHHGRTLQGQ